MANVRVAFILVFAGSTLMAPSCAAEEVYVGGECGDTTDCWQLGNFVGAAVCVNSICTCARGLSPCCPGGIDENCRVYTDYQCRPESECSLLACDTPADCPPPIDARCNEATCTDNECGLNILNTLGEPIKWDTPGDCRRAYCTADGVVVSKEDPSDAPISADPCREAFCKAGVPTREVLPDHAGCLDKAGICLSGACVECIDGMPPWNDCQSGEVCDNVDCVAPTCVNFAKDGAETGTDCGGPSCAPCPVGESCAAGSDCQQGVCVVGKCVGPSHTDNVKNGNETGVDCCEQCPKLCADSDTCVTAADCQSAVCYAGICQKPSCFDDVKNGGEEGLDCDGPCDLACSAIQMP